VHATAHADAECSGLGEVAFSSRTNHDTARLPFADPPGAVRCARAAEYSETGVQPTDRQQWNEGSAQGFPVGDVFELAAEISRRLIERDDAALALPEPRELADSLDLTPPRESQPLETAAERMWRLFERTPSTTGHRFFNQLFGGRDDAALLGEIVAAVANTSMYTYKAAGAQVLAEQALISHMGSFVGWPECDGLFTPGGSMSNFAAMMIARNEAIDGARDTGYDSRRVAVYTSVEAHYSVRKNVGMLGMGRDNVRAIGTDTEGRMCPKMLDAAIREDIAAGVTPVMVVATSGTTVQGAFDPLREIAAVTGGHGVWLHVDGAYGGSLLLSKQRRHLLDGCELADSFTWDAHKMMGVPLTSSVALFRDSSLPLKHLDESATYLFQRDEATFNPGMRSLQCGRRNDSIKLWVAWQHHGDAGYERRIERLFALAAHAVAAVEAEPRFTLVKRPQSINTCFTVEGVDATEVCDLLDRAGRAKVSHGTVDGVATVRLVCVNPDLTEADLDAFFDHVRWAAGELLAGGQRSG